MRRTIVVALWSLIALAAAACRGCWLPDRSLGRRVAEHEVVGTWRMTPESLALLERDGFRHPESETLTMTFREDGSVRFASALDRLGGVAYQDVSGAWTL